MSTPDPSKLPGPPKTPTQRGHWLLLSTVHPEDIDGLANFAQAITHPSTSGCWGGARCECPFNPADETPEAWEQRVFNCLWGQLRADIGPRNDKDLSSQDFLPDFGLSFTLTYNGEAYEDGEIYDGDSTEIEARAYEYNPAREEEVDDSGEPHEEGLGGLADAEAEGFQKSITLEGQSDGSSGLPDLYSRTSDGLGEEASDFSNPPERNAVEPEASTDKDQLESIANGLFRGSYEKAIHYIEKEKQKAKTEAAHSQPKSNTGNGASASVRPSIQANDPGPAAQPSMPRLQGSTQRESFTFRQSSKRRNGEDPRKRKRAPELEEDLEDEDDYKPPSKKDKGKFSGFAECPPHNFSKNNSGRDVKMPKKKARRAPATTQGSVERIPRSTWPKSEGDELNRLLRARRDFERTNNIAPLRDEKLFMLLSEQLKQATQREKSRTSNACKNFWNRYGRDYYDCDERGDTKRSESKVTSAQTATKVQKAKQQTKTKTKTKKNEMQQTSEDEESSEGAYEGGDWDEEDDE